jgi:endonuclease/exonuclease/phosphatase family metal-dependent hydrolase
MKLISLNAWGGRLRPQIAEFLQTHHDTDIFLLQEVFHEATSITKYDEDENEDFFNDIQRLLPDHVGIFAPVQSGEWGLAAFVSSSSRIEKSDNVFVHRTIDAMVGTDAKTLGRSVQCLSIESDGGRYSLMNFHGLWTGINKQDNDERIQQSKKIVELLERTEGKKILAGDFNLLPENESVRMIEDAGMKNLIKEFDIQSTRTSFYTKPEKFADFTFVTPDIQVHDFKILPEEVSDHAAMYLEFDV